jgi:hypothetical protein
MTSLILFIASAKILQWVNEGSILLVRHSSPYSLNALVWISGDEAERKDLKKAGKRQHPHQQIFPHLSGQRIRYNCAHKPPGQPPWSQDPNLLQITQFQSRHNLSSPLLLFFGCVHHLQDRTRFHIIWR